MRWTAKLIGLMLAVILSGCAVTLPSGDQVEVPMETWTHSSSDSASTAAVTQKAAVTQEDVEAVAPTPTPEPVLFEMRPYEQGEPLSARDIFAHASPAVAHIDTPTGTGSAVLTDHGYLVSAAHVVWPYEAVRAVFADGSEYAELPVAAWDLMRDLALLGPIDLAEAGIEPLTFSDGTDLPIGSEVYLIGYPAEFEEYPQPALGRGLLSRTRHWDALDLSMFQVDGDASGGQSGGAMIDDRGGLLGITNYRFSDSNSPMVTSAADVVPALTAMLAGEPDTFTDHRPLAAEPVAYYKGELDGSLGYDYFILFAKAGDDVDLNVDGVGNPTVLLADMMGNVLETSSSRAEQTNGLVTTLYNSGPYFVEVGQSSSNRNDYTLTSSHPFYVVEDEDDDQPLQVGDTYIGSIDHLADEDVFTLDLEAGDRVIVQVESLAVDPFAIVSLTTRSRADTAWDDDSGPTGLFGLNARLVVEAHVDGEHLVAVSDAIDTSVGGYILTVTAADEDEPLTETVLSDRYYGTPQGRFQIFESPGLPFTMLFPAYFVESAECDVEMTGCYESDNEMLLFFEFALDEMTPSERSTEGMADQLMVGLQYAFHDAQLVSDRTIETAQGHEGALVSVTAMGNTMYSTAFAMFDEDIGAFAVMYTQDLGPDQYVQDVEDWLVDMLATTRLVDADHSYEEASHYLEEAKRFAAGSHYGQALGSLAMALALDEESAYAYEMRSAVQFQLGNHESAVEDLQKAIELRPKNIMLQRRLAAILWQMGDYETAIAGYTDALDQRRHSIGIYNGRALVRASAGDYEGALRDLSLYEEKAEDGLPSFAQDTRAYVHLKFDALEEALADYEELIDDDFQAIVTLLGAGVTYARLDRMDEAQPLLEYGMEQFEEAEFEVIDPQLADLLEWAEEYLEKRQ